MPPVRSLSVLMPTWQGREFLGRVLAALAAQRLELPWDMLAIDSGSTDGTLELLAEAAARFPVPLRVERIDKLEFDHGDTRNLLAARSQGELLVFLTQDAIPADERFLAKLARNFEDPAVGAAYCRNLPRPDAELLTKVFSAGDPGYQPGRRETRLPEPAAYAALSPHERRLLYNFNDVASAVRRELWERHPFPRTSFGEDVLMARALLEAGYTVVYDDQAVVEHSHDYDPAESYARAFIDGRFNAEWLDRDCVASEADARVLTARQLERDRTALEAAGLSPPSLAAELERARALRSATFLGLHAGGRSARRRPATRLRESGRVRVLFVVHGFPPDTWAGTEIYTQNLALELQRRGHGVAVLARVPAERSVQEGGPEDFAVEESSFQGLRVLRMTHRLAHGRLAESYRQPRAEAAFRSLLLAEQPDVVHFQHLIHTSAGLVHVARELGLPSIVHCHDYWALCARVQLIRPDGARCERNMGSGCFLCVKEEALAAIPMAERLGRAAGDLALALAEAAVRSECLPQGLRRSLEGYADLAARQEFVLGAYAAADLCVSPSRFLRAKLLESGAFEPHTFLYSDNGMRTDHVHALAKRPDPAGRVRFGFVGSLVWYKGGEVLVRAMRLLRGQPVILNVYGSFDPERDPHHAELARLAEGAPVQFHGRFDNARLSEVYAQIDVLVVPSVWFENSPITIHEAHLTRTPVLASDIGGMAEYVRDGVDGLHFRVGDEHDLAAKMRRFVEQPDLLARLSRSFPAVKTIAEDAAATEFRYRALACIVPRERGPRLLLELGARQTARREGGVEEQGRDLLLLRPGGGAVEYDLSAAGPGRREVVLSLLALGVEPELELGGRVLLDGVEVHRLGPFRARGEDLVRAETLDLELSPRARLRVECALSPGGPEAHLRLGGLAVREAAASPRSRPEASP